MEIKKKRRRSKKGIMLTLLTIIIFVLMLSEITAYIVININFNQLTQLASAASNQGDTAKLIAASADSLLHASLSRAAGVLSGFEASPSSRMAFFPNSTSLALESLMENGTLDGSNLKSSMGSALIGNLTNTIAANLKEQGIGFSIENSSLSVFDGSPSTINASYIALAVINTSTGTFTFPLVAKTSIALNGTVDISGIESAQPNYISVLPGLPSAKIIGGTAAAASTSPYSFVYGTIVEMPGTPVCSSIPSQLYNENTILVTPDASDIPNTICGMGGVVTGVLNSSILKPYLVYDTGAVFNSVVNGTKVLLDGNSRALIDTSPVESAIQNGSYFGSAVLPSYLDRASAGITRSIGDGLFSFNLLQRTAPRFSDGSTGASTSNVYVSKSLAITPEFSVSFWFNKDNSSSSANCGDILSSAGSPPVFTIEAATMLTAPYCGGTSMDNKPLAVKYIDSTGSPHTAITLAGAPSKTWVNGVVVFGANSLTIYINGQKVSSSTGIINPPLDVNSIIIGSGAQSFNGSAADVQIYNAPLSGLDAQELYLEGIAGLPLQGKNLTAWYPLNGNGDDYSGDGFNGTQNGVDYRTLSNYYGDPIYSGTFTDFNSSVMPGVENCGNFDKCSSQAQHLYLQDLPLTPSANESAALGLPQALPKALAFTSASNDFLLQKSSLPWFGSAAPPFTQPFTLSIWVYPKAGNGVIIDENNFSESYHNSLLELSGGSALINYKGSSGCQNLGTVPLDGWTNIVIVYSGASSMQGYINGAASGPAVSGTYNAPVGGGNINLGESDSHSCGTGGFYNGLMADYQAYNAALTPAQVAQLYLNNSLSSLPANMVMPLGIENKGMPNTTAETITNNYGLFDSLGGVCSAASAVSGECGIYFTPP